MTITPKTKIQNFLVFLLSIAPTYSEEIFTIQNKSSCNIKKDSY